MKNIALILFFLYVFFASSVYGQQENKKDGDVVIPPGMETIRQGDVNVLVPVGGQLRKQGNVMLIESADEYAARKFADTDERFKKIENEIEIQEKELETQSKELEAQKKDIGDLKSAVKKLEEDGRKK